MSSRYRCCLLLLLICLLACRPLAVKPVAQITDLKPTVILISFDGFRWDYFDQVAAPNFHRLAAEGVRVAQLIPSFPSKTFPNHYTIVTGLYPEHHGIVFNKIFDPEFNAHFDTSNRASVQDGRWWGGEPIWVSAEKQGQHSAT